MKTNFLEFVENILLEALGQTLYMTIIATVLATIIGFIIYELPFGLYRFVVHKS